MEKSTPIGLVVGLGLIYGTIFMGDGWITFFDPMSLIIVLGGTVSGLLVAYNLDEVKQVVPDLKQLFTFQEPDLHGYLTEFTELSRTARREGLLALDRRLNELDDEFLCFGLEMAVDGIEEDEVTSLMRERIANEAKARGLLSKFLNLAGTYCPAFGMIGTLIGLIQMLQNLSDPSAIGAGMAVAMITTFYGALFANLVFLPLANKAKTQLGMSLEAQQMIMTGVLGIVRGESPSMLEKRLLMFVGGEAGSTEAEVTPLQKAA